MKRNFLRRARTGKFGRSLFVGAMFSLVCFLSVNEIYAQARKSAVRKTPPKQTAALNLPKVTQIDGVMLNSLLKREGEETKPLLVNFWATWCVPCIEEFPDLVKLDNEFRGKVEIITVSLDDLAEINTSVPKFLAEMKAEMPAYLLKTQDEGAAISSVSKEWSGALPFTILLNGKGETAYSKQGKFKPDVLRAEIEKVIAGDSSSQVTRLQIVDLPILNRDIYSYETGVENAKSDIAEGRLKILYYGLRPISKDGPRIREVLDKRYGVQINDSGCMIPHGFVDYAKGYNEISTAEIQRKFGKKALALLEKY